MGGEGGVAGLIEDKAVPGSEQLYLQLWVNSGGGVRADGWGD